MSQSSLDVDFANLERINHQKTSRYTTNHNSKKPFTNFNYMGIRYSNLILATQRFLLEKHNQTKFWTNSSRGDEPFPFNDSIQ